MNNITLKSIKCESIKSIFASIADAEKISRAEISSKTDLSLVTVGKVADALLDMNIVCQVKEVKPQAGRRAGLLGVNPDKYAVVLDLTSYDLRVSFLNLRLQLVEKYVFENRPRKSYDENLHYFLSEVSGYINRRYSWSDCFGVGVSCPGPYNATTDKISTNRIPELGQYNIKEVLSHYFKNVPFLIDSHVHAAARSNMLHIGNYDTKTIVYWYVGCHTVCGAFMVNGEIIPGRDHLACDFGKMIDQTNMTVEERLMASKDPESFAKSLAHPMHDILRILNPHTVIIEFDIPVAYDDILPLLQKNLQETCCYYNNEFPEFHRACCQFRNSHRGLTMGLRDMWIDKLVFGNND